MLNHWMQDCGRHIRLLAVSAAFLAFALAAVLLPGSSASAVLPGVGSTTTNMLAWQDPDTGMYFRLQGRLDQDTLIRIAESVR